MSMNFEKPISDDHQGVIKKLLGDKVKAIDSKTTLFDASIIKQRQMKEIANLTKQVVEVGIHDIGDIKTMVDGTRYLCTISGWKRLPQD